MDEGGNAVATVGMEEAGEGRAGKGMAATVDGRDEGGNAVAAGEEGARKGWEGEAKEKGRG